MSVLAAAELTGSMERGPGKVPQPLAIVGPFQPAAPGQSSCSRGRVPACRPAELCGGFQSTGSPVLWRGRIFRPRSSAVYAGPNRDGSKEIRSALWCTRVRGDGLFLLNGRSLDRAAILKTLREIQPELVHAHWTFEAGPGRLPTGKAPRC